MTRKEALSLAISALTDNTEATEVLAKMMASLDRKPTGDRKPTKTQQENAILKQTILEFLSHTLEGKQAKDIATECGLSSPQKASALLTQLVKEGKVVKVEDKSKPTLFLLPEDNQFLPDEVTV